MGSEELRDSFHYLYRAELPFLKELALMLPAEPLVINIGAGAGTSGLALMESRPDLRLITIDITKESSPFGCLEAEETELRKAGLWGDRNQQIHGDSKQVGKDMYNILGPMQADMVFIDGEHSYEGASGDIEIWLQHLVPGGIIAVHDYRKDELPVNYADSPHPKPWPGVDRAVDEMLLYHYKMIKRVDSLIAFWNIPVK